jgi:hypothetical protein
MKHTGLPLIWEVPTVFRERLGDQAGRQRAMFADGHLLLVLHAPPAPDQLTREGRFFWRKPDGIWQSTIKGSGFAALQSHLDEYLNALNKCEEQENRAQSAHEYFETLAELGPIVHASKNLLLVLQEARKLVPADRNLINIRDRADDLERTGELLYQVTRNGLDFAQAKRAEEQAKISNQMATSAHRLNLLVAFFFPIATLTTMFGTGFVTGYEEKYTPIPLLILFALGLLSGFVLLLFLIRRPKT